MPGREEARLYSRRNHSSLEMRWLPASSFPRHAARRPQPGSRRAPEGNQNRLTHGFYTLNEVENSSKLRSRPARHGRNRRSEKRRSAMSANYFFIKRNKKGKEEVEEDVDVDEDEDP